MTNGDETAYVARWGHQNYHTDPECNTINGPVDGSWTVEQAENWGKTHCKHCQGGFRASNPDQDLVEDLHAADPEDLGLSPLGERRVAHD